ncbi:lytic transglycosylase domain-containing protein [Geodermatophilus sp. YIM 151500]|uniref:aggregation-promoting factor C-terminal-like domain-containing protein n=1 Tax=Geodermatophilus sp. YIM 151500 TaxID=2984531 RepID=UPI0021E48D56|nr:lytic transglycosylase domain-containing protein [Geodermatophilus sp. YIM 151500]MCV2487884.1 lytic transglycosylase domain-containing protein [Geodermatophilus sp. YIM 151500]
MSPRTPRRSARTSSSRRRPPASVRRPGLYLGVASAGAVLVAVVTGGEPVAHAEATTVEPVSVAEQLGVSAAAPAPAPLAEQLAPLEQLAASRSERAAEQDAAAAAQAEADRLELERRAAEEAARTAAEEAARKAAEEAARAAARPATKGSFKEYALGELGGDGAQFSCLENLWGKESGWNPDAQNPTSSAYGIPQFLDSTWAGTGIGKTSDGYRQIDAGLVYIEERYGSPCAAWKHSQAKNWY